MKAKNCPVCGNEFLPPPGHRRQKYCSEECYHGRGSVKLVPRDQLRLGEFLRDAPIHCCQCGGKFVRRSLDQITCGPPCYQTRNREMSALLYRARQAQN